MHDEKLTNLANASIIKIDGRNAIMHDGYSDASNFRYYYFIENHDNQPYVSSMIGEHSLHGVINNFWLMNINTPHKR